MRQNAKPQEIDFRKLSETLITTYTKGCVAQARKLQGSKLKLSDPKSSRLVGSVGNILTSLGKYSDQNNIEKALESIDIGKIYEEVDILEQKQRSEQNSDSQNSEGNKLAQKDALGYEDFIVKAALKYFKNTFFKWVNQPPCTACGTGDHVKAVGSKGPPNPNPDEISVIELYQCGKCKQTLEFPRIDNPARLLDTRKGRCGEWVNCFMLILKAISSCPVRYVWNAEDHVWCEYYSKCLKRWVHLDPCENAFDEPSLYCQNWGKKMSWVIGIGELYVSDLSSKYVTKVSGQIAKSTVANEADVAKYITLVNASLLLQTWNKLDSLEEVQKCSTLYHDVLLVKEQEFTRKQTSPTESSLPIGRQTGSAQWTAARGENGS